MKTTKADTFRKNQILFNGSYRHRSKKGYAMNADKLVVGLAGMPGSGKSLVVETARELGYAIVVMGDVIREETAKRGLQLTPQNVGKVMLQLRAESGNAVVAMKCIPKIEEQAGTKVLVDGLRSLYEVDAFKFSLGHWFGIGRHVRCTSSLVK